MSATSKIEWTDATWNPTVGCSKVSPGCKGCYAILEVHRMAGNPNAKIAAANAGLVIGVKKTSASNSLIVDPNSSELIDGAATLTATAIQAALLFYCDGTGWQTISRQGTWS